MSDKRAIDTIKEMAEELGITPTELLRESGTPHSTLQNWERDDPKPFKTMKKIQETYSKLKAVKPASASSEPITVIE